MIDKGAQIDIEYIALGDTAPDEQSHWGKRVRVSFGIVANGTGVLNS